MHIFHSEHTKQLLLMTFCDTTAKNGANFQTHRRKDERKDGRMDRQTGKLTIFLSPKSSKNNLNKFFVNPSYKRHNPINIYSELGHTRQSKGDSFQRNCAHLTEIGGKCVYKTRLYE